ncbi:hypothetical protein GF312_07275 [Candidatus Poribacteria bacterium]|nr:hypothetical protein [Candidatus Poribacteria bacterium]
MKSRIISILMILICFAIPAFSAINPDEIVLIWTFDEGEGQEVFDLSGKEHTGEIMGNAGWTDDGKFGKAIEFSGGHVLTSHAEDMNLETFSFTAWIKVPDVLNPYQMVMGKESWPSRNYSMWLLPDKVNVGITEPDDKQLQSADVVVDGEWHHVGGAYDKENLTVYVDGKISTQVGPLNSDPLLCETGFMVGAQPPAGGGPLHGIIDEVSVFNVGMDVDDIESIMENGLTQFAFAVSSDGKLSVTWGSLKDIK